MNSDSEQESSKSIESQSDYSVDDVAEVFPIDDYSGDELEKQLNDFKKFNSKKLVKVNDEEEDTEEGWGRSRRDYYGASESDDDEGEEAIKIQKAQLQKMREEDYFGEFTESTKKTEKKLEKLETFDTEKFNTHLIEAVELLQHGDYDPDYVTLKFLYLTNLSFYYSLINGPEHENRRNHPVVKRIEELEAILDKIDGSKMTMDHEFLEDGLELDTSDLEIENATEEESEIKQEGTDEEDETKVEELVESDEQSSELEEEYEPIVEKKKKKKTDAFGEIEELNEADLLDKKNRRKALNFRVSQVEQSLMQKSHQRGGDDDLPFKTKAKKEYSKEHDEMSLSEGGDPSQSGESESEHDNPEPSIFGEDEYYQKIKNEKLAKKKQREEKYAQLNEPLVDNWAEPEMEGDEKRKATWRILANRGLTPFRKKENRNPRVKKRMKYEKAVKKLPSTRRVAVDKKKLSKYGGEMTGIKSNLARSTKF
jgi:U3 small nucleolar RNA-associated protein 3